MRHAVFTPPSLKGFELEWLAGLGSWNVQGNLQGILQTAWGPVSEGTPREDPGMSKGGSRDVQGILWTAWGPVSEGTPREDPRMSKRSSGQHGGLCLRGHQLREDPGMAKGFSGLSIDTCRQHWTSLEDRGRPSLSRRH